MTHSRNRIVHLVPLAIVQIASIGCGIIGVRWSSTVVPPAAFGIFGLLLSAQQLATSVTHQGFIKHVQRYWTRGTSARAYIASLSGSGRGSVFLLMTGLALATAYFHWAVGLPRSTVWWIWLMAVNLLAVVAAMAQAGLQAEERYWAGCGVAVAGAAARSFLPPLLVTLGAAALPMLATGYLLHIVLFAAVALWALSSAWRRSGSPSTVPSPVRLVATFIPVGAIGWAAAAAPRWFAAATLSADETGYFILATNLAMVVPASASVIGQNYSFPVLFATTRDGSLRRGWSITLTTVVATVLATELGLIVLAWCAPYLIGPIIAVRYAAATNWLLAAGGAILATLSGPLFCNLLISADRPRSCVWLTAFSAAVRLGIMTAAVLCHDIRWFRLALVALPFPTLAVEWTVTWLALRHSRTRPGTPSPVAPEI